MITTFLRFPDRAAFLAAMPAGFVDNGEAGAPLPAGVQAISILGTLHTGGTFADDGSVIEAQAPLPGYHVNALGELPDALAPFVVNPSNPQRIFG